MLRPVVTMPNLLRQIIKASRLGFDQVLWLDALEHRYIEEMSGMNFCRY